MPINPDKLWADLAGGLRRKLGLDPAETPEESEARDDSGENAPLDEEVIDRILEKISTSDDQTFSVREGSDWCDDTNGSRIRDDMRVLNRNADEQDPAVRKRLDILRKKAIEKKRAQQKHRDKDKLVGGEESSEGGR